MRRGDTEPDADRIAAAAEACVRFREGEVHDVPLDDLARRRLIDDLVDRAESYRPSLSSTGRDDRRFGGRALLVAGFGGALAASVLVGLAIWAFGSSTPSASEEGTTSEPRLATAELNAGSARLETIEQIDPGSAVLPESTFEAGDSGAILSVDDRVELLVDRRSRLTLVPQDGVVARVRLERGAVLALVEPRQPATEFTVETAAGAATALGTVFAVFAGDSPGGVAVFEGQVAVETPKGSTVLATGRARDWGADTDAAIDEEMGTLVLGAAQRIRGLGGEWGATELAELDLERLFDRAAGADEQPEDTRQETRDPVAVAASSGASAPPPASRDQAGASPSELSARIREAMRLRRWREAAELYRQLIIRFPESRQAQVAWVSLGSLQLGKLGEPGAALVSFEQYLAHSQTGPLAIEAGWGKARSLRRLRRFAAERAALEEFVARHPYAFQSQEARQRLAELQRGAGAP